MNAHTIESQMKIKSNNQDQDLIICSQLSRAFPEMAILSKSRWRIAIPECLYFCALCGTEINFSV